MIWMLITLLACQEDLAEEHDWNDDLVDTAAAELDDTDAPADGPVRTFEGEVSTTVVDATDAEAWVPVDLDAGGVLTADTSWDLRVQRFTVELNGGVSGDGGVEVVFVPDATLDALPDVPTDGWTTDAADGDDEDEDPDRALDDWYDYDFTTHVLRPKPGVWFLRSTDGNLKAFEIVDYYNEAGDSGWLSFDWRLIEGGAR